MSLAFDESGRPFIILREQAKKKRVKGMEAHKVSINHRHTAIKVYKVIFTSFELKLINTMFNID